MTLYPNDSLWKEIYVSLLRKYSTKENFGISAEGWDAWLAEHNIKVVREGGRVDHFVLPDDEELTLLLLQWIGYDY